SKQTAILSITNLLSPDDKADSNFNVALLLTLLKVNSYVSISASHDTAGKLIISSAFPKITLILVLAVPAVLDHVLASNFTITSCPAYSVRAIEVIEPPLELDPNFTAPPA